MAYICFLFASNFLFISKFFQKIYLFNVNNGAIFWRFFRKKAQKQKIHVNNLVINQTL